MLGKIEGRRRRGSDWYAGMHVHGWSSSYVAWELVGPATIGDKRTTTLYVRTSNGTSTWGSWRQIYDTSNKPTKSDVGLGNVDNTADANKSVNYATSAGSATTATKLGTSTVGGTTTPIYLNAGVPTALGYTIAKSVPSNAVFTDHYAWSDITGKPDSYTPSSHTHPVSQLTWGGGVNLAPTATANGQEWSIDLTPGSYTGTYWHVWSAKLSKTILACYTDDASVQIPNGALTVGGNVTATKFIGDISGGTGLTKSQVTTALGYTPYNSTNPNGYITSSGSCASATKATQDSDGKL